MLSGRRAWSAASSVETLNAILKEDPPDLGRSAPDLPPGLERIVQHCLEKSPDERFQSARDLGFQLEALSAITAGSIPARAPTASILIPPAPFVILLPPPPRSTLFPYTTLFRSRCSRAGAPGAPRRLSRR